MPINNITKSQISYNHPEIKKIFDQYIKGELYIDHFSINLFFGNQSIFLSPTPKMAEELCKKNFVNIDANYKKEIYTKYSVFPWRSVALNEFDHAINTIKEEKFGMRNGMMIIRNLGKNRYAMYSFATHRKGNFKGQIYFLYHCKANYIAQMGDFMYNELLPIINEYTLTENITMPKITNFVSLEVEENYKLAWQTNLFNSFNKQEKKSILKINPIPFGLPNQWIKKHG